MLVQYQVTQNSISWQSLVVSRFKSMIAKVCSSFGAHFQYSPVTSLEKIKFTARQWLPGCTAQCKWNQHLKLAMNQLPTDCLGVFSSDQQTEKEKTFCFEHVIGNLVKYSALSSFWQYSQRKQNLATLLTTTFPCRAKCSLFKCLKLSSLFLCCSFYISV